MVQKIVNCLLLLFILGNITTLNAFTDEELELMAYLHNTCIEASSATEEMVKNAQKGNFADDQSLKCYIFCITREAGGADEKGVLDPEALIAMMPQDVQAAVSASITECCSKAASSDPCEQVWLAHKCFYANNPDAYFIP